MYTVDACPRLTALLEGGGSLGGDGVKAGWRKYIVRGVGL